MATYYLSENGGALTKEASTAANPMDVSVHNAETFSAGDIIEVIDDGDITSTITPPSSGSSGNPITYNCNLVDIVPASGNAILLGLGINYVTMNDPQVTGNGDASAIQANSTSGAGGVATEITNILNRPRVLSNGGGTNTDCDGIDTAGTARLLVNDPYVRDCFNTSSPTTGSHQAFTAHDTSILSVNRPDVDNVNTWAVAVSGARITINGGILKGAKVSTLEHGGTSTAAARIVAIGVNMLNDQTAKHPQGTSTATATALILIFGGEYRCTGGAQSNNRNIVTWVGTKFRVPDGTDTFRMHTVSGGITNIYGCDFGDMVSAGGYCLRVENGHLDFVGNFLKSYDDSTGRFITFDDAASVSGNLYGNYFGDIIAIAAQGFIWVRGVTVGTVKLNYNTFGSETARSIRVIDNDGIIAEANGNTFINLSNVIDNGVGASVTSANSNTYINSESTALGGTGDVDITLDEFDVASMIIHLNPSEVAAKITGNGNAYWRARLNA